MNDKDVGWYRKFNVKRINDPEGKHDDCEYFVIDLHHDEFAAVALLAYAEACLDKYPKLSMDLVATACSLMK